MANMDLAVQLKLIDKLSTPLQSMIIKANRLNDTLGDSIAQLERFNGTLTHINQGGLGRINNQARQTSNLFERARQHAKGLASDLRLVFNAISSVQKKADSLSKSFANYRKGLREQAFASTLKMGGAAAMGYQMIAPAIAFDKQMSATQAVLELEKGSAELTKLRNQAIYEGARSAFSASEAAAAQFELGAAGFNTKQVFDSLGGTLDLAAAGQLGVARAAEIAGGVLNGFGMQANEVSKLGDVMVATANKTSVGIEDIGEAMKMAAPVAKMYGVSLEQAHAMVGLLGNSGIKGTEAGTGLKAIFARLAAKPKKTAEALADLRIETVNKDGTMRDINEIFNELRSRTEKLSADQRISYFKDIAGQEHFSKLEPLLAATAVMDKNTGQTVDKFKELTKELENSSGAAQKVADVQLDNLAGDIDALKGAWESFSIALGGNDGVLNATLRSFAQNLTETINKITAWVQKNPELVKTIGSLLLKFIKLNLILFSIKYSVALVLGTFFGMLSHFLKFGAIMMLTNMLLAKFGITFWARFKLMAQAVLFFSKVFAKSFVFLARQSIPFVITMLGQLTTALLTTPIGWLAIALVGVALLVRKYWQPLKAFFGGFWQGFLQGIAPLREQLSSIFATLQPVFAGIVQGISWLVNAFMTLIAPAQTTKTQLDGVANTGRNLGFVFAQVMTAGINAFISIGTAVGTFAGMVVVYGGQVLAYISSLPSRIISFLIGLPTQMMTIGGQIMDGLKNGITSRVEAVVGAITSVVSRIKSTFTGAKGMDIHSPSRVFKAYGGFMMQGLDQGLTGNAKNVIHTTQGLTDKIKDGMTNIAPNRTNITGTVTGGQGYMGAGATPASIVININGATDPQAVARAVQSELARVQASQSARERRRMMD